MISEIVIKDVATFDEVKIEPKRINFIYGSNGSGKTTLSKLIGNPGDIQFNKCEVVSSPQASFDTLVFNKDFVKKNFQGSTIKGIFTLGEDTIESQNKIDELNKSNGEIDEKMKKNQEKINEKTKELEKDSDILKEECWKTKYKYSDKFSEVYRGFGKKDTFFSRVYDSYNENIENKIRVDQLENIADRYQKVFNKNLREYEVYKEINIGELLDIEVFELLEKNIVGSSETEIGKLINFLQNSDWVRTGISYIEPNDDKCPFCNQKIDASLKKDLIDFFNESYEADCNKIKEFRDRYRKTMEILLTDVTAIISSSFEILNYDVFKEIKTKLNDNVERNISIIDGKILNPSQAVTLVKNKELFIKVEEAITDFNNQIRENNKIFRNKKDEQKKCVDSFFNYIAEQEMSIRFDSFAKKQKGLNKVITELTEKIRNLESEKENNVKLINENQMKLTDTSKTIDSINKLLRSFGFGGFSLKESDENQGDYAIVRENGEIANETLSEGEYNFITFLYFYNLVFGSHNSETILKNKIVVIDDPISSLDNNILFIVSALSKKILDSCRNNKDSIVQLFVLTHNIYFHKEVSFNSRGSYKVEDVMFGVLRKNNNISSFSNHKNINPITTSYELMWRDLFNQSTSPIGKLNLMRRILEHYFKVIGGIDYEKEVDSFEDEDKILCKALISNINDGSHSIYDDDYMMVNEDEISNYLRVFKAVFEKLNHLSHYEMMLGRDDS